MNLHHVLPSPSSLIWDCCSYRHLLQLSFWIQHNSRVRCGLERERKEIFLTIRLGTRVETFFKIFLPIRLGTRVGGKVFNSLRNIFSVSRNIISLLRNIFCILRNIFHIPRDIFRVFRNIFRILLNIFSVLRKNFSILRIIFCISRNIFWTFWPP